MLIIISFFHSYFLIPSFNEFYYHFYFLYFFSNYINFFNFIFTFSIISIYISDNFISLFFSFFLLNLLLIFHYFSLFCFLLLEFFSFDELSVIFILLNNISVLFKFKSLLYFLSSKDFNSFLIYNKFTFLIKIK